MLSHSPRFPGLAPAAGKLAKLGLETIQDLLLHLPLRYEDRTRLYPINDLLPGIYATVEGKCCAATSASAAAAC